jgi:flagellar basal-body rod modification protein FlgD
MTDPIYGVVGASKPAASPATTQTSASNTQFGKDTFLKLLVAQMRYQDPSKPADGTEFLAQTAQFTMVEKLSDMATMQHDMLAAQQMLGASSLVGKTVTYTGSDGLEVAGVVSSAMISGSSPTLRVGTKDVPLSSVKEVRSAAG